MRIDLFEVNPRLNNNMIAAHTHRLFTEKFTPRSNALVEERKIVKLKDAYNQILRKRRILDKLDDVRRQALLQSLRSKYIAARINISSYRKELHQNLKTSLKIKNQSEPFLFSTKQYINDTLLDEGKTMHAIKLDLERRLLQSFEKEARLKLEQKYIAKKVVDLETKIRVTNGFEERKSKTQSNLDAEKISRAHKKIRSFNSIDGKEAEGYFN